MPTDNSCLNCRYLMASHNSCPCMSCLDAALADQGFPMFEPKASPITTILSRARTATALELVLLACLALAALGIALQHLSTSAAIAEAECLRTHSPGVCAELSR